jgi:hypothetical protein
MKTQSYNSDFITHGCEQVLRFTRVGCWDELCDERKIQLAFNFGVAALGLNLNKIQGYDRLSGLTSGNISMSDFHNIMRELYLSLEVNMVESNIIKPF